MYLQTQWKVQFAMNQKNSSRWKTKWESRTGSAQGKQIKKNIKS